MPGFDPRSKFAYLVAANLVIFHHTPLPVPVFALTVALIVLTWGYRSWGQRIVFTLFWLLILGAQLPLFFPSLIAPYWGGGGGMLPFLAFFAHRYCLAGFYVGWFFRSTTSAQLIRAAQSLHLPANTWVPLAVICRFLPTVQEAARALFDALRLRGLWAGPITLLRHPIRTVQVALLPFIYTFLRAADQLSAAVLTRGLGLYPTRTTLVRARFTWADSVLLLAACALLGWVLVAAVN